MDSDLRPIVEEYLQLRRKLGFQLAREGDELMRFANYAEEVGHTGPITIELAVRWATLPRDVAPVLHAKRLAHVRRLAKFRAAFDSRTAIPPEGLLGSSQSRRRFHIYTAERVRELMQAAAKLRPLGGLRPLSYSTLFGLLASTGMRISEALRLTTANVDLRAGIVSIPIAKFHRARIVPLHPTVTRALRTYAKRRDEYFPGPAVGPFFRTERGSSLARAAVSQTFGRLRRSLRWPADRRGRLPRIHDLRHTFATQRLLLWSSHGANIDNKIAALSTYLGHVRVTGTYWYMTGIPELLATTARRFERFAATGDEGPVK